MSTHEEVSPGRLGDPDFTSVEAALRRAGERARREAAAVGGRVVVFENGKIVWEKPGPEWLSQRPGQPKGRKGVRGDADI